MSMENRLTAKLRAVRRRYRRAFTLVEVSVVVAICGSLASLAVSRYFPNTDSFFLGFRFDFVGFRPSLGCSTNCPFQTRFCDTNTQQTSN